MQLGSKSRSLLVSFLAGLTAGLLPILIVSVTQPSCSGARLAALRATGSTFPLSSAHQQHLQRREYQEFLIVDAERFNFNTTSVYTGYSGPWFEDVFRHDWQDAYARGVHMGERIFLPIRWNECFRDCPAERKVELQNYLHTLKPEFKYFTAFVRPKGLAESTFPVSVPQGLDLMLFATGSTSSQVRTVPLPHLKEVLKPRGNVTKDIDINFYGAITHQVRADMLEALKDHVLFGQADNEETNLIIERSNYTLAPRGFGSTSYRLYEALQLLSVPIYIWAYDLVLPYQELVNWNDLAIIVHHRELHTIPDRIAHFDLARAQSLMKKVQHLWTYEFTNQYVFERLRSEESCPVPFSVHTDMPGRD